jgi:hypothetical protein
MFEDIKCLRDQVDYVIVSLHWGIEGSNYPNVDQISLAQRLIDVGADIIWGHHAHVIQPIVKYKSGIICFGLGNFAFRDVRYRIQDFVLVQEKYLALKPENKISIGVELTLGKGAREVGLSATHVYVIDSVGMPQEQYNPSLFRTIRNINRLYSVLYVLKWPSVRLSRSIGVKAHFNGTRYQTCYTKPSLDHSFRYIGKL